MTFKPLIGLLLLTTLVSADRYSMYDKYELNLYTKECSDSNPKACKNLADIYMDDEVIPPNKPKALGLYKKACKAGNTSACLVAGTILESGSGVEQDLYESVIYFDIACKRGSSLACKILSTMYKKNSKKAEAYKKLSQEYK